MTYVVREVFYTLQGEGSNSGRPAVFCRFAGCNLWTGREEDRADAICQFCDTQFRGTDVENGGGKFRNPSELAKHVANAWPRRIQGERPLVVCTGGEPLLQLDTALIDEFHAESFEVGVETNGTIRDLPEGIDHLCVSPKARAQLLLREGTELKLVHPQAGVDPSVYEGMNFDYFYLQPMEVADQSEWEQNTQIAMNYCLEHPKWSLSLQTQKYLGLD